MPQDMLSGMFTLFNVGYVFPPGNPACADQVQTIIFVSVFLLFGHVLSFVFNLLLFKFFDQLINCFYDAILFHRQCERTVKIYF